MVIRSNSRDFADRRSEPSAPPVEAVSPAEHGDGLTELSFTLWRQRRLLELLVFKLEVQQLLLAAGRNRWLDSASREVEAVLEQMRHEELGRAVQVRGVAANLGLDPEASLAELINRAPVPWDGILRDHQEAFMALTADLEALSRQNRDLLTRGYQATREFLAAMVGAEREPDGYSAAGQSTSFRTAPRTVDRAV